MGSMFKGPKIPPPPPAPPPPPPPAPPPAPEAAPEARPEPPGSKAADAELRRRRGRAAHVLTAGDGVPGAAGAPTAAKTLLGQ